ncbi:MAG: hypothetical protein GY853_01545 [PVC group bacterium]|nr:hypothetical protein [PVC group bacterium]
MNNLTTFKNKLLGIEKVEDTSDMFISRLLLTFKNGMQLSIVRGYTTYGGELGLYEIAPINKAGLLDGSFLDEEDSGDNVCGWLDFDRVCYYINKIKNLK